MGRSERSRSRETRIECEASADCTSATASRCVSGACTACAADEHCAHLTDLGVCDAGTCVKCVSNADCLASEGCELASRTCRTFVAGGAALCGGCVRDAECLAGQLCVPMTYDDPATGPADPVPVGNHCLWREDADGVGAPSGDCFTIRPFVRAASGTSVDGVSASVCTLAVSTCEAHANFRMLDCMTLDADGNARCGLPDVPDGVCRRAGKTTNRCTVYCTSIDDCPSGVVCDTTVTPRECAF